MAQEDLLEKIHSSILAWKIPLTEEPGGLHSPCGRKESDTPEQLTLSLHFSSALLTGTGAVLLQREEHLSEVADGSTFTARGLEVHLMSDLIYLGVGVEGKTRLDTVGHTHARLACSQRELTEAGGMPSGLLTLSCTSRCLSSGGGGWGGGVSEGFCRSWL